MPINTPDMNPTELNATAQVVSSTSKRAKPSEAPVSGTILVVVGFALGAFILLFDYYPFDDPYIKTLPFKLFFLAIIAQTVFWAVAFGSMWPSFSSLKGLARDYKAEVTLWTILFATLIYCSTFFAVSCEYGLRNHGLKTSLLTYTGGVVALMAGIGSILVNIALRNLLANPTQAEGLEKEKADAQLVSRYLQLRGYLLHFLSVLGVMLGLVALAQTAKRYLIVGASGNTCEFPVEKVLVFGLYYTVILVLTFLPTFSTLIATGHRLRDDIMPIPSPHSDSWSSKCAKREKLAKLLALSMAEGLRALIAVLAPIIGSLISLLSFVSK